MASVGHKMKSMKNEIVDVELERDGKIERRKVSALVKPLTVESGTKVVDYVTEKTYGFATGQPHVEDGEYTITYIVHGKRKPPERGRVEGMRLLGGWLRGK